MVRLNESFGYTSVNPAERRRRIRDVFRAVAARYDLMNDVMSFGIHRLWKRTMVHAVAARAGERVLDLAGGTGDVAALLVAAAPGGVTVCDPCLEMMAVARRRLGSRIALVAGEAEALPFPDGSLDAVTVAFGLRNVTSLENALAEILRVLRPGGRFVCLEFSRPRWWFAPFYDLYSFHVIPRLGAWIAREPSAYTYLVESIRRFPDQRQFAALIEAAGYREVGWRDVSFGIASLHSGRRPSVVDHAVEAAA